MAVDYKKIGFKCGLELHQELDVGKLFCECSSQMKERGEQAEVTRKLRPVAGETGRIDPAVLFEHFRNREFVYHVYENEGCLVELDAEPPHSINKEALETALKVAVMLKLTVPAEIRFMRKTVCDGSAVSGFQRTALVGIQSEDSKIETSEGDVSIESLSLEEDASKS